MKYNATRAQAVALAMAAACFGQSELPQAVQHREALVMLTGKDPERSRKSELVQRVRTALREIDATRITQASIQDQPNAMPWRWVLLNEVEWHTTTRIYATKTPLAFGNLQQRVTYLRASRAAAMSSLELQRLLAHELGHLICGCTDENRASDAAEAILKAATARGA